MTKHFSNMRALSGLLAEALNLIDSNIENHHQQTAYLAYMIAKAAGLDTRALELVRLAALMHDIGFITMEDPGSLEELESHAVQISEIGARLIEGFPNAEPVAQVVRYCQSGWYRFLALPDEKKPALQYSARIANIVHLADVVSALLRKNVPILNQVKDIRDGVSSLRGSEFSEEAVSAFLSASENEYVWMDLRYNPLFLDQWTGTGEEFSLERTVEMTSVISRVIDFRSSFTAMHSAGVAAAAVALAGFAGMDADCCQEIQVAGLLHDIGKLKIPRAILEKPGRLTEEEFNIVKEHPYYTYLLLSRAEGFERISRWAGYHHEKLNGTGYPFHLAAAELDTGARIMAVSDIFSAVAEDRPYRPGMGKESTVAVLNQAARSGGIDPDIVTLLYDHYDDVDHLRSQAALAAGKRYDLSIRSLSSLPASEEG
ncbi:MAG: HD domain-containing protein [Clostridia bacterium]|nr:HD domain-containing protein [Clostridia bacterium]